MRRGLGEEVSPFALVQLDEISALLSCEKRRIISEMTPLRGSNHSTLTPEGSTFTNSP